VTPAWSAVVLALSGPVELRGGLYVDAPVVNLSLAGVEVGGDEPRLIGWDSVKLVLGERADEAESFMQLADRAWRARVRLAREDFRMATPLFEELFERFEGASGPTALMVAEGLARCRVWRGDVPGAVTPWLEAARLREAGVEMAGDPALTPVLDPETLLLSAAPPIFLETDALRGLAESSAPEREDTVGGALRAAYRRAARFELGLETETTPGAGPSHDGARFVRQIVDARTGDASQREAARFALKSGLEDDFGTWREAWRRVALGRSLLREDDPAMRTAAMFHMVHVPARFARSQPYLAGVALAEMSLERMREGDGDVAAALRAELERLEPHHPALAWLDARVAELEPAREAAAEQESPEDEVIPDVTEEAVP